MGVLGSPRPLFAGGGTGSLLRVGDFRIFDLQVRARYPGGGLGFRKIAGEALYFWICG